MIEGDSVEEDENFEDEEEDIDEEDLQETSQMKSDLYEEWLFPYHKNMRTKSLPKTTAEGKYCRIFGRYEFGKKPVRNVFQEQEPAGRKVPKKQPREPASRYKSYTAAHNTCADCSISVGNQIIPVNIVGTESRLLIPNRARFDIVRQKLKCLQLSTLEVNTLVEMLPEERFTEPEYSSDRLKSWIFTPTHGRAMSGNLNLTHNMVFQKSGKEKFAQYVHVLVVRRGQFEEYCRIWGSSHVILELPDMVPIWYQKHQENCTAEAGKIGYARKFIQAFAEQYSLNTIFMLDDNMPYFYEIVTYKGLDGKEHIERDAENRVKQERVPLYKVLKHVELLHDTDAQAPKKEFEAHKEYTGTSRGAYTGPPNNYGVIGIRKHDKYNTTRVVNPFKNTHVYSLCMLNIKVLEEKGIRYQPWQAWEDLHLNNECDDKGLYVVKYNRFKVFKRNLSTWQREGFQWSNDVELKEGNMMTDEEGDILFRWIRRFARPGRCEKSWPADSNIPSEMSNLVDRIMQLCRAKDHIVAVHPKLLRTYLEDTRGLMDFVKHVLVLPLNVCIESGLKTVRSFRKELVEKHFKGTEKGGIVRFKVVTSHNVQEFRLSMILVYVEGKSKLMCFYQQTAFQLCFYVTFYPIHISDHQLIKGNSCYLGFI